MICQNLTKTGFGFGGFMHLICKSEIGFAKPLKPVSQTVSLINSETVQLFTLIAMDKIAIKKYDVFIR